MKKTSIWHRYSFLWVTLTLFLGSLIGHWLFAWFAFVEDQRAHGEALEVGAYFIQTARDTLENWQSEFLQLIWAGSRPRLSLAFGLPSIERGDERKEEKLDRILEAVDGKNAQRILKELDEKYPRK